MNDSNADFLRQIQEGGELPNGNKFYANGYSIAIGAADVAIVLLSNNQPVAYITASHMIAKAMGVALTKLLEDFERDTKVHVYDFEEVQKAMLSIQTNENKSE